MMTDPIKRGDIVLVNFGENSELFHSGCCPAVVLQRSKYNKTFDTTVVAPISTVIRGTGMTTHVVIGRRFGLLERSMIVLEQIQTIDQDDIDSCIGHINDDDVMRRINVGLRKILDEKVTDIDAYKILKGSKTTEGIAARKKRPKKPAYNPRDIMCLCPVCRDAYRHRGYRVMNVGGPKDICDYCNYRSGVDYAVVGLLSR